MAVILHLWNLEIQKCLTTLNSQNILPQFGFVYLRIKIEYFICQENFRNYKPWLIQSLRKAWSFGLPSSWNQWKCKIGSGVVNKWCHWLQSQDFWKTVLEITPTKREITPTKREKCQIVSKIVCSILCKILFDYINFKPWKPKLNEQFFCTKFKT